ncbi:MAG: AMP-binding protein [Pseudomonadales bacterium]|nr:AMP-binding protein [Pseudomonadales bacterium]MCP5330087.1 AMP-binding protein [Pseudomonadales bacterium]MCP5343003.1 AMP-binding protein [Pseudomonadales bacterium]
MNKLWSAICHHAMAMPDGAALQTFDGELQEALSWKQLKASAEAMAHRLREDAVGVLALQAGNAPTWVLADIACSLQDIVLLPLPGFFSAQQVLHALRSLRIDAVLTDRPAELAGLCGEQFSPAGELAGLGYLRRNPQWQDGMDNSEQIPPHTSKITFTSGSTGTPKGVCLSAGQMQAVTGSLLDATAGCDIERHLCVLPLATLLENIAGVHAPLRRGATVVLAQESALGFNGASGFSLPTFLHALSVCRPGSMILIPQLLEALVMSCDAGWQLPDTLQFIAVGGATVSPDLLSRAWAHGMPVYEGYGLSECGSVVCLNRPDAHRNGSLGKVLPHTHVEIVDDEIVVTGPAYLGYVGERDSWCADAGVRRVATGDLGRFDDEGYLYYQGRRKNVLVSSFGRNISPEWVEAELNAQGEIAASVVFGDSRPYCVALVAASSPAVSDAALAAAVARANARLPAYAQARRWVRLTQPLVRGSGRDDDLVTSNGRPRRAQIFTHFQRELEALYANDSYTEAV